MNQVTTVSGRGIPLRGDDIDTDRVIPARFLRCVTFDGLGDRVFADDRAALDGQHPFDLPVYRGARLLVVNANFGCGSSREHAPQALIRWGIRGIIGESFAEIFSGNCIANGVPCVTAPPETVRSLQDLLEDAPHVPLSLSLERMEVERGDFSAGVTMGAGARQMLLEGSWDTGEQLLQNLEAIRATAARLPYFQFSPAVNPERSR